MEILVVFVNDSKSEFVGEEGALSEKIRCQGKTLNSSDTEINVRVIEGNFQESVESTKVKIIMSSETFPSNVGKLIPDFKKT